MGIKKEGVMKKSLSVVLVVALLLVVAAWVLLKENHGKSEHDSAGSQQDVAKIVVFTSIVPQTYFVKRIGGERVEVQALVKPGSSPATYEPSPRQMAALSDAKLFFRIGVPFENGFIPKIEGVTKGLHVVDTRNGIELRKMTAHHHHDEHNHEEDDHHKHHDHDHDAHAGHHDEHEHDHDEHGHDDHHEDEHKHEEHHHHHGGKDPHIWLSPRLVKIQARTIADALIEVDPESKALFEKNLNAFLSDLDQLDSELADALAPVSGKTFMVFHPAWGYLADDYGLKQESIEIEGKDPSAQRLAQITEMAKDEGVRVIFVQPQFSKESATNIADGIGGAVIAIDPLSPDYLKNMQHIANTVREALQKQQ